MTAVIEPVRPVPKFAVALLSLAVGIVLADSAVVTLALPSILREFDAEVSQVAWVLIGFNLVLALAAVPAARIVHARRLRATRARWGSSCSRRHRPAARSPARSRS